MQNRSKILALSLATIALAGCSSMQDKAAYTSPQMIDSSGAQVDEAYVLFVEEQARRHGVDVQWVNPPSKSATRVATTE